MYLAKLYFFCSFYLKTHLILLFSTTSPSVRITVFKIKLLLAIVWVKCKIIEDTPIESILPRGEENITDKKFVGVVVQVPITFSSIRKANYPNKTNITANLNSSSFCNRVLNIVNHEGEEVVEGWQFQRFKLLYICYGKLYLHKQRIF